ncbi:type I-E CRISPR-associated protein Cas6/Cse3/CasE [Actinomycetaceae bacterium MB13-C1-2]|nr:type I-E CRISPR-associated protein Cas6/Cse3/CasE [Actinomycetaceae bacterium MB13-C1-2]
MYLTRMYLNPRRRQTLRMSKDPQVLHAAVESAFPPTENRGRILWRLDESASQTALLIVSRDIPSLEHLQEQAGWETERTWDSREYDPLLTRLHKGQRYRFRLTANPTHIVTGPDGTKRRKAHVSERYQAEWLQERAESIGVKWIDSSTEDESAAPLVTKRETLRFKRGQNHVTLARVTFEGGLEVIDADALRSVLVEGIGRGKAYGCGLMTLAPARSTG